MSMFTRAPQPASLYKLRRYKFFSRDYFSKYIIISVNICILNIINLLLHKYYFKSWLSSREHFSVYSNKNWVEVGCQYSCGGRWIDAFLQVGSLPSWAWERRGSSWSRVLQEGWSTNCDGCESHIGSLATGIFPANFWAWGKWAARCISCVDYVHGTYI